MSITLISLVTCPFCQRDGDILVNSDALRSYRRIHRKWERLLIHKRPDQKLFVFNSSRPDPSPCEHVVQIYGEVHWSEKRPTDNNRKTGGFDFDWWHEHFDQPTVGDAASHYLWEVIVDNTESSEFQPKTQVRYERFQRAWQMPIARPGVPESFSVHGGVVFAEDVPALFAEVPELIAKNSTHFGNRRDDATSSATKGAKDTIKQLTSRAAKAISVMGYDDGLDLYGAVSDLLADLHHLTDQHNLDFDHLVDIANRRYGEEIDMYTVAPADAKCIGKSDEAYDVEYEYVEVECEPENASLGASQPNSSTECLEGHVNETGIVRRTETSNPNQRRAKRAAKILVAGAYKDDGLEWDSAVADSMTDFRHLADLHGFEFESALIISQASYSSECREDVDDAVAE